MYRMGVALAETVIARHRRRLGQKVKRITIDLDPTDDPTRGAPQLTFFNRHLGMAQEKVRLGARSEWRRGCLMQKISFI